MHPMFTEAENSADSTPAEPREGADAGTQLRQSSEEVRHTPTAISNTKDQYDTPGVLYT
jgi:hypothetical protein